MTPNDKRRALQMYAVSNLQLPVIAKHFGISEQDLRAHMLNSKTSKNVRN